MTGIPGLGNDEKKPDGGYDPLAEVERILSLAMESTESLGKAGPPEGGTVYAGSLGADPEVVIARYTRAQLTGETVKEILAAELPPEQAKLLLDFLSGKDDKEPDDLPLIGLFMNQDAIQGLVCMAEAAQNGKFSPDRSISEIYLSVTLLILYLSLGAAYQAFMDSLDFSTEEGQEEARRFLLGPMTELVKIIAGYLTTYGHVMRHLGREEYHRDIPGE